VINLSGINTEVSTSNANHRSGAVSDSAPQQQIPDQRNSTDKVTISADAKMASDLEKLALPNWIGTYTAPLDDLTNSFSQIESTKKYQALFDGVDGSNPKNIEAMKRYLDNDAAVTQGRRDFQQREAFKTELQQYGEYHNTAYKAAMEAVGVTDSKSYYDIVTNDPSAADRAHSVFKETLFSMSDIRSLMSRLDVPAADQS